MESGYFSEWLKRYQYYLRMRNYSDRTIQSYDQVVKYLAYYVWLRRHADIAKLEFYWNDLDNARLDTEVDVSPVMITDFFTFLSSFKTYKPKTIHRMISSLSSFYRYLFTQGVVLANPMVSVERPRIKDQELRYLKHSQVLRLIGSIDDTRDRLIIRTIYATGMRVSEIAGLNIEDIDFEEHTIRVRGKGGKIRVVFIDEETLSEINTFIGNRIEGPLFIGQQGAHISARTIQHLFRKYAPVGITPHKIRHSYASELYRRSKNLRVVQENLGHSSIKTTEIYLHTDLDERKQVYQQFFPLSDSTKDLPKEPKSASPDKE
ncbi:MAG: site-specific tyrosine recombinase/integron integrase [Methanoregulaceae archaeon]